MHEILLLVDKNHEFLTKNKAKWVPTIQTQIEKYYSGNGLCDWATIGGNFTNMLKSKDGACDICDIADLVAPIDASKISFIEFVDPNTGTIYNDDKEFAELIKQINSKQLKGVVAILDLHR